MNILLTGGTGFLGSHIKAKLHDFNITELNRTSGEICNNLANEVPDLSGRRYDLVIHTAGKAHSIPANEDERKEFYSVNVDGTKNLLIAFERSGAIPRYFVFISTVAVYGLTEGVEVPEMSELLAKDAYGLSKIQAELLLMEWCEINNVTLTIIRPPLIIGNNATGNLKDLIKSIDKGYYFNIGGGRAKKSMVLAEDIARFIMLAHRDGGCFVLTDGYHPTFHELSNVISKSLGRNPPKNLSLPIAKVLAFMGDLIGKKAPINTGKLKKIISTLTFSDENARNTYGWKPNNVLTYLSNQQIKKYD